MHVLITGGLGYIGSHITILLLQQGYYVDIIDNLANSSIDCLDRIKLICDIEFDKLKFYRIDLCDLVKLDEWFGENQNLYDVVIHAAGHKSVNKSINNPLSYYANNVNGSINLFLMMEKYNCKNIIFSSSASIYGSSKSPLSEESPIGIGITNPYSRSKFMIEQILSDIAKSEDGHNWKIINLRYFNPISAHSSGLIGENPNGIPNNVMPIISRVITGDIDTMHVFGNDYNTPDGTCIRDFIHIEDLASGHVSAVNKLISATNSMHESYNLGTGNGYSVKELIDNMNVVCNKKIKYLNAPRRIGDIDIMYASVEKAKSGLDWSHKKTLPDICNDQYNYIKSLKENELK